MGLLYRNQSLSIITILNFIRHLIFRGGISEDARDQNRWSCLDVSRQKSEEKVIIVGPTARNPVWHEVILVAHLFNQREKHIAREIFPCIPQNSFPFLA